MDNLISKTAA